MYLHRRPDLLEAMAAAGQVLVPTLAGYYWMAGYGYENAGTSAEPAVEMTPMLADLAQRNIDDGAASLQAARRAGVKIALGSDVSLGTALEFRLMIRHALSPAQALTAATSTAASALGLAEHIGTVEEGKLADLVIADGDPLEDSGLLTETDGIWLVLQLGVPVAGRALEPDVSALAGDALDAAGVGA
jgi:imidazolonepropionase-like amidohydrolase